MNSTVDSIVGKVRGANGLKGALHIIFFVRDTDWLEDLEEIELVKEGDLTA